MKNILFDKKRLYPIVLILLMFVVYKYREHKKMKLQHVYGQTMGTTYNIKYLNDVDYKPQIDSILKEVNLSLSTYIPESEISQFNQNGVLDIKSKYFYNVISKSKIIFNNTNGAFDPTIMPLVNAWGFGFENKLAIDSSLIDSLLQFVDFTKISFDKNRVESTKNGMMLDFSAIAKGYGVDVIADFLKSKKIYNYMVEVGGEIVCLGKNYEDAIWRIGIDNPNYENDTDKKLAQIVELDNIALATSGNYRNFYLDENGVKRAHTINPVSGYPVTHSLLSVSVKAKTCMAADGYATALMVSGFENSKKIASSTDEIEVFLIYENDSKIETWSTSGFFN